MLLPWLPTPSGSVRVTGYIRPTLATSCPVRRRRRTSHPYGSPTGTAKVELKYAHLSNRDSPARKANWEALRELVEKIQADLRCPLCRRAGLQLADATRAGTAGVTVALTHHPTWWVVVTPDPLPAVGAQQPEVGVLYLNPKHSTRVDRRSMRGLEQCTAPRSRSRRRRRAQAAPFR